MFDVSLEIIAEGEHRTASRDGYIVALADTLIAGVAGGTVGDTVVVEISARNNVPVSIFKIPIEYSGAVDLTLLSQISLEGCRTDYFEAASFIHFAPSSKLATIVLQAAVSSALPPLEPGYGPVAKLKFIVSAGAPGASTPLVVDGYSNYEPMFTSPVLQFQPGTRSGSVTVCVERGNVNLQPGVDVSDLTWVVDYLFAGGPPPLPMAAGDVDCDGNVNVSDVTYLVDFLFAGGPPPCDC
jgi:hypothetical protein